MLSAPCLCCGSPVEFDPDLALGNADSGVYCLGCIDRLESKKATAERNNILRDRWLQICPPLYRDTVLADLPFPGKSAAILDTELRRGLGLNLWGHPDTGKTRTLYLVLERLHQRGQRIVAFSPGDFTARLEEQGYHRGSWIKRLSRVDVLAFDDVDKLSLTKDRELAFFALLDQRMAHRRPCMFTHNSTADELEYKFRNGAAMVRRIRQFTLSFHFPKRP